MESNKMFKFKQFMGKVNCLLGIHRFEIEKEYSSLVKCNSYLMEYKHTCSTCGCSQDVVESYSKWEGRQLEVTRLWYMGDYNFRNVIRMALVKFNSMFGGMA